MQRELIKILNSKFLKRFGASNELAEIPSPAGLPFLGTTLSLIAAGSGSKLHEYIDKRHQQLGPIFRETLGNTNAIFIADAHDMRKVIAQEGKYPTHVLPEAWVLYNKKHGCSRGLFFMNGEEWYHMRTKMNKILLSTSTADLITEPCMEVALNIVDRWKQQLTRKGNLKIHKLEDELYRWSIDVMIAILLGSSYNKYKPILDDLLSVLPKMIYSVFETTSKMNVLPVTIAERFQLPPWINFTNSVRNTLKYSNHLMDIILSECKSKDGLIEKMREVNFSEDEIRRIVIDLILAAGDTTAYSMEWILHQLSRNVDIQEKIFESVNTNEKELERPLYLKCVIKETLRLHPVAPFLTRYIPNDINIRGYTIPRNSLIVMSLYTIGRNQNYFKNPDKFSPERWLRKDDQTNELNAALNNASIPFAMGSRSCIGRKIAETQMCITLTKLIKNFYIENANEQNIEMILRLVSVPSSPIQIRVHNR